jgi:predicted GIY-YIG superfamily endonuclease
MMIKTKPLPVVYRATNLINGKIYIGITSKNLSSRISDHVSLAARGGCMRICRAIRKYGPEMIRFSVVKICKDYEEAKAEEIRLIALWKPQYNTSRGGDGLSGLPRTKEWKAKISAAHKGRKRTPAQIEKMKAAFRPERLYKSITCLDTGEVFKSVKAAAAHFEIGKRTISEALVGRQTRAGGHYFVYGAESLSEEDRISKIAELDAIKSAHLESGHRARCRAVVEVNTGTRYESARSAAKILGISPVRIMQICQAGGQTSSGMFFRYADSNEVIKKERTQEQIAESRARQEAGRLNANSVTMKKVICLDTGFIYPSITEAANDIGASISSISAAIYRNGRCMKKRFSFAEPR